MRAGFRVKRATYWNTLLFPLVLAVRLIRREKPSDGDKPARSDIVLPPAPINAILTAILKVENLVVRGLTTHRSSVAVVG